MYVMYYASMLRYWQLVWILFRTNHPCLRVGCHNRHGPRGVGFVCVIETAHHHPLCGAVGAPEVPTERPISSTGCRLKSSPTGKPSPPLEPLGDPLSPVFRMDGGQNRGLIPMLQ
jgi:hypothetical protein